MKRKNRHHSKLLLPKPRPPTYKELRDQAVRKKNADIEMQLWDEETPAVRQALNDYGGYAIQVEQVRGTNPYVKDEDIVAAIKRG